MLIKIKVQNCIAIFSEKVTTFLVPTKTQRFHKLIRITKLRIVVFILSYENDLIKPVPTRQYTIINRYIPCTLSFGLGHTWTFNNTKEKHNLCTVGPAGDLVVFRRFKFQSLVYWTSEDRRGITLQGFNSQLGQDFQETLLYQPVANHQKGVLI